MAQRKFFDFFLALLYILGLGIIIAVLFYPIHGDILFKFYDDKYNEPITSELIVKNTGGGRTYKVVPDKRGHYLLEDIYPEVHTFSFTSPEYNNTRATIQVESGKTTEKEVRLEPNFARYNVKFYSSTTNRKIPDLFTVVSKPDNKTYQGNGGVEIPKMKEGSYVLHISANQYYDKEHNITIKSGEDKNERVYLTPKVAKGARIVLEWGSTPSDLDSHLLVPPRQSKKDHVYYQVKGFPNKHPFAQLDVDDTSSFGPETITIFKPLADVYRYAVHNYSGSPSITTSQARVSIYDKTDQIRTFQIPTSGEGLWWLVCDITFDSQGRAIINEVNKIEREGWRTGTEK
jgi:hypothetical protein